MNVIGVDPGAKGGVALVQNGDLLDCWPMPHVKIRRGKSDKYEIDGAGLAMLMRGFSFLPDLVLIEQVGGMQGQSASAAFNFGRAAGAPEWISYALGYRTERVSPVKWKNALMTRKGKDGALATAAALWPGHGGWLHHGQKEFREGMAEAALIALYGWRMLRQERGDGHDSRIRRDEPGTGGTSIFK